MTNKDRRYITSFKLVVVRQKLVVTVASTQSPTHLSESAAKTLPETSSTIKTVAVNEVELLNYDFGSLFVSLR